jgi:hypothetical protein
MLHERRHKYMDYNGSGGQVDYFLHADVFGWEDHLVEEGQQGKE